MHSSRSANRVPGVRRLGRALASLALALACAGCAPKLTPPELVLERSCTSVDVAAGCAIDLARLDPGTYLVLVENGGMDTASVLEGPRGRRVFDFEGRLRSIESTVLEAGAFDSLALQVRQATDVGATDIRVLRLPERTRDDRRRIEAEREFANAFDAAAASDPARRIADAERAASAFRALGLLEREAWATHVQARLHYSYLLDWPNAEALASCAVARFEDLDSPLLLANARALLGMVLIEKRRGDGAEETRRRRERAHLLLLQAAETQRSGGAPADAAWSANAHALGFHHQRRFADAESAYRRALALAEDAAAQDLYYLIYQNLGALLSQTGDIGGAVALHESSVAYFEARGAPAARRANVRYELGNSLLGAGFWDRGIRQLETAYALQRDGNRDDRMRTLLALARATLSVGLPHRAEIHLAAAELLAADVTEGETVKHLATISSLVDEALGRTTEAIAGQRRRVAASDSNAERSRSLLSLATMLGRAGNVEEATGIAADALDLAESPRDLRAAMLGLASLHLDQGDLARARARIEAAAALRSEATSVELKLEQVVLGARLAFASGDRSTARSESEHAVRMAEQLRDANRDWRFRRRFWDLHRVAADILLETLMAGPEPDPVTALERFARWRGAYFRDLRRQASSPGSIPEEGAVDRLLALSRAPERADDAWVVIVTTSRRAFAYTVARGGLRSTPLATSGPDLDRLARRAGRAIAERAGAADRLLDELAATLAPAFEGIGSGRIVLVADGELQRFPLAALPLPDGRRMIERFAVTVAPTVAAATHSPRPAPTHAASYLVVANSTFASARSDLPNVASEVAAIRAATNPAPLDLILDDRATREPVLTALGKDYDTIHVATHGVVNNRFPLESKLVLADGELAGHELLAVPVGARLVTLSACETASGQASARDGTLGLSDLLLAAGAEQVIGSLWLVSDRATAALMGKFYEQYVRLGDPSLALAAAQRFMAASEGYGEPYFWAGWIVLSGESHGPSQPRARGGPDAH